MQPRPDRGTRRALLTSACFCLAAVTPTQAVPPAPPTNLRAFTPNATSYQLRWFDNSTDETHFRLVYSFSPAGGGSQDYGTGSGPTTGQISLTTPTAPAPPGGSSGGNFSILARKNTEISTSATNTVFLNFTALSAPTLLAAYATTPTETSAILDFSDNTGANNGYSFEYRLAGSTSWTVLGTTGDLASANLTGLLAPGTAYEFRCRASLGPTGGTFYSGYSNVASLTTPFNAPTGLAATTQSESSVRLTWSDNSQAEQVVAIYLRLAGTGNFVLLGYAAPNATSFTINGLDPATAYEFQVAAAFERLAPGETTIVESARSQTAAATTTFHAPTGLTATPQSESTVGLSWTDNSQAEQGVAVYVRVAGTGNFVLWDYTAANATTYTVAGLDPATAYEFQVAAAFDRGEQGQPDIVESARSQTAAATTRDIITSAPFAPITFGQPFTYQLTTTSGSPRTSCAATGLPANLSLDPATGIISGTPAVSGLFVVNLSATFANGWTADGALTLRITRPPAAPTVATPLPAAATLPANSPAAIYPLEPAFADPDSQSAVRLATTLGPLDVLLYDAQTPATVANFLGYVGRGDFDNSAFHRLSSAADSGVVVLQGGLLTPTTAGPDTFTEIQPEPAVVNEPGISNQPLTIAMAKAGGNPNSATSQFYFNLDPLNTTLDAPSQNGGFTVFGRVSLASATVLQTLAASPVGGPYPILIDGAPQTLPFKWPLNVPSPAEVPATMDNTKTMNILTAQPVPTLTLQAASSHPTVAAAAINAGVLEIAPLTPGLATITVTATDLDGLSAVQSIAVTVTGTYSQWAAAEQLPPADQGPGTNPDGDRADNLLEYALLTDPQVPDTAALTGGIDGTGPDRRATITFPVRKFASDLVYRVRASATLAAGDWTEVWNSTQGFAHPAVLSATDQPDRTVVTVRDPAAGQPRRFLKVLVEQAP